MKSGTKWSTNIDGYELNDEPKFVTNQVARTVIRAIVQVANRPSTAFLFFFSQWFLWFIRAVHGLDMLPTKATVRQPLRLLHCHDMTRRWAQKTFQMPSGFNCKSGCNFPRGTKRHRRNGLHLFSLAEIDTRHLSNAFDPRPTKAAWISWTRTLSQIDGVPNWFGEPHEPPFPQFVPTYHFSKLSVGIHILNPKHWNPNSEFQTVTFQWDPEQIITFWRETLRTCLCCHSFSSAYLAPLLFQVRKIIAPLLWFPSVSLNSDCCLFLSFNQARVFLKNLQKVRYTTLKKNRKLFEVFN